MTGNQSRSVQVFQFRLANLTDWHLNLCVAVKRKVKFILGIFCPLLLMLSQSGCTYMLWSDENYEAFHQPAPNSDLHLYESKKQNDILVVYKEQSERNEHIHTRAYWLNRNQIRVTDQAPPFFINKKTARNLPAVPVFDSMPTNRHESFYAVFGTNQSFTLFSGERELGSYTLPMYDAERPVAEKIAFTPVTMTADASIAAAVAGIVFLIFEASSSAN
jgi:hypothetical protein